MTSDPNNASAEPQDAGAATAPQANPQSQPASDASSDAIDRKRRARNGPPNLEDALREGLSKKEAQRLALRVSEALAARHVRGEAHGELTPRSILLGRGGDVSIMEPDRSEPALYRLRYAAPEIARREAPCAGSDVFALSLVIRELVEGLPARRSSGDELAMEAVDGRVSAPHGLDGELQSLAVLAASPHPDARPDASEFVAALRGATKFRGFSGQEWVIAGIALAAALMLAVMLRNSAEERDRAGQQFEEARAAFKGLLSGIYPELDRIKDIGPLALAGERALSSMEQMRDDERTAEDHVLFAQTLLWNGEAKRIEGQSKEARILFERAIERCTNLEQGPVRSEIELRSNVALGVLARASKADFEALQYIERAIELGDAALRNDPDDRGVRLAVARAHLDLGSLLATRGTPDVDKVAKALETSRHVLQHASLKGTSRDREVLELRSEMNLACGQFYGRSGYEGRAITNLTIHVRQAGWLVDLDPARPLRRRAFAEGATALGERLELDGRYADAVGAFEQAQESWRLLRELQPQELAWRREWARSTHRLAVTLGRTGEWQRATDLQSASIEVLRNVRAAEGDGSTLAPEITDQLLDATEGLLAAGDLRRAQGLLVEAKGSLDAEDQSPRVARTQIIEAELLLAQGSWGEARNLSQKFIVYAQGLASEGNDRGLRLERARARLVTSAVDAMRGHEEDAVGGRRRALGIALEVDDERPNDPQVLSILARAHFLLGNDAEAADVIKRLEAIGYRGLELAVVRAGTSALRN